MAPWFTMPSSSEAHRRALTDDVRARLDAMRCTVRLLRAGALGVREHELLDRLHDELGGITRSLERLERKR